MPAKEDKAIRYPMALSLPTTTLTLRHRTLFFGQQIPTRFFVVSGNNVSGQKWIHKNSNCYYNNYYYVSPPLRFPIFTSSSSYSLHSLFSFCSPTLFSYLSLCSLFKSRNPSLRSPFSSMTTINQSTPDPPPQSLSNKTVRVVIKGRVQGVFYRNWTVENATQLGLKGWVRNRRDGSVEALFSGDSVKVQEMERRCHLGPPDAMVTGVQVFPSTDDPGTGFQFRSTV